jgi:hypothetical protein
MISPSRGDRRPQSPRRGIDDVVESAPAKAGFGRAGDNTVPPPPADCSCRLSLPDAQAAGTRHVATGGTAGRPGWRAGFTASKTGRRGETQANVRRRDSDSLSCKEDHPSVLTLNVGSQTRNRSLCLRNAARGDTRHLTWPHVTQSLLAPFCHGDGAHRPKMRLECRRTPGGLHGQIKSVS